MRWLLQAGSAVGVDGGNMIWKEVIVNDIHIPKQSKPAVQAFLKAVELIKPHGITLNGDIMDCGTFSRHDINKQPKCNWSDSQFYQRSKHEYAQMNDFLDKIDRAAPKARKRYELGNHEVWIQEFIKESPESRESLFGFEPRLSLKKRGYTVYQYGDIMRVGKLRVTHGLYSCKNHAKKHLDVMGKSILYGHLHNIEVASKVSPEAISHMAWANGCLCEMNPAYLRNKPQDWNHGFAVVYVWPSGVFQVDLVRIQNGKCIVWGQEIGG